MTPTRRRVLSGVVAMSLVTIVVVRLAGADRVHQDSPTVPATALLGHHRAAGNPSWSAWPQALHDAQHTGASPVTGPATARVRWTRQLEGDVTPGPVIAADGTIYAASNAGVLHALDPATGEDRWKLDGGSGYGVDTSTSPAVLPNGSILWPGPDSSLWALNGAGQVLWKLPLRGLVSSPAVTARGAVVVGDSSGSLVALRPTQEGPGVQWRVDLEEQSYGSPVWSADGKTAFQSVLSGVVAVRNGAVRWRSTAPTAIVEVSPAVAPDGTVVIGTNDPYQYGLDPSSGSVRWRFERGSWTYSSPGVTADGITYFGDHANRITGLDVSTGQLVFRFQGSRRNTRVGGIGIWTSVLVDAEHTAYVGTRQGLIYSVDRSGELRWQLDVGATVDSYPALAADGTLIIGVTDGRLLAIGDG